jgi:hypothetical protein
VANGRGTIGAPPAVINAVIDALRPLGVDAIDMPATRCGFGRRFSTPREGRRCVGLISGQVVLDRFWPQPSSGSGVL